MQDIIKKCLPTYEIVRKIGSGVYGVVYHVKDNLKERAVKVVPIMIERSLSYRTPGDLDSKISHDFYAIQEYYHKIKGEGVIEIYDFHLVDKQVSKQGARAYLVILMEFCPYNLLDRVLDHFPLPPESAEGLMTELAEILNRLSDRAGDVFIVKDLKPSNLLVNQNNKLVIGDLGGLQRISSTSTASNAQFTPNWSAPELITHSRTAGIASLIFSYGFVSYFIWSGSLPYEQENFTERLRRIKEQELEFTRSNIPFRTQILISHCLNFRPEDRPKDFKAILEYLRGNSKTISPAGKQSSDGTTDTEAPGPKLNIEPALTSVRDSGTAGRANGSRQNAQANTNSRNGSYGLHKPGDNWVDPAVGMVFVWVPTGVFQMGSGTWDGEGNKDELPLHEVFLDGFWLGKYPVTQEHWKKVMTGMLWYKVRGKNPSWFKKGGDYPVEQVSWNDARDFIQKLTAINKGRYHFRLPTEAEWEYASRSGGRREKYAGGNPPEKIAWYSANSGMATHPVGRLAPNGLNLYDMSGNVYEWCADTYNEEAYRYHEYKNPIFSKEGPRRVIRGGSWCNFPRELRCSYRASVSPDFNGNYLGLRVVMTPGGTKKHT
ncbi:MAG: SUMF1/EgtB/PvdO family nonheme iron enzyme [Desulfobacteraceae bacterium]|nr:SUMF1/EgtB/PvdO family nonheme iron enzyme [Desulfobacteraceae bacterium]MCF8094763.1 SUMF1/EgtB/PvdO family nonheme iron enzyme [Desulfobacteraceae bacterium]